MNESSVEVGAGPGMMTVHEVAEYLRLSEAKIYEMAREGHVPALRLGKKWRFKRDLIDDWIRRETELSLRMAEEPQEI
jgi:excisionase family DNA binding protein